MNKLIAFHMGLGTDHKGRFIKDIWQFDSFTLEHDHSYIQWLFPIDTSTKFNTHAPQLTSEDRIQFSQSLELVNRQQNSLLVMLNFFGIELIHGKFYPTTTLNSKDHIWLRRGGHNHLRISRIIRSLALCGQIPLSQDFLSAVLSIANTHGAVSNQSKQYWINAVKIDESNLL